MKTEIDFTSQELTAAPSCAFSLRMGIRFQDVDAAGIVFYPRVFEYFSDAYMSLLTRGGIDLPRVLASGAWVAPLVHAQADYSFPMRFGDRIAIEIVTAKLGRTSFSVGYRIRGDAPNGCVHALGYTVHVALDRKTMRACPIPPELAAALRSTTDEVAP